MNSSIQNLITIFKKVDKFWLITWLFIFSSFTLLDMIHPNFWGTTIIKYTGILINVLYAYQKFRKDHLLQIALLFTLLADTILVLDHASPAGVFTFCLAQFFHISRLAKTSPAFFGGALFFIFTTFALGTINNIPIMFTLGFIYATFLSANLALSARLFFRTQKSKSVLHTSSAYALYGFILFACCDSCVAVSYLSYTHVLPFLFYAPANYFAWIFYYPSQLLVSNSSLLPNRNQN